MPNLWYIKDKLKLYFTVKRGLKNEYKKEKKTL